MPLIYYGLRCTYGKKKECLNECYDLHVNAVRRENNVQHVYSKQGISEKHYRCFLLASQVYIRLTTWYVVSSPDNVKFLTLCTRYFS